MKLSNTKAINSTIIIFFYMITIAAMYMNGIVSLTTLNPNYLFLFPLGIVIAVVAMSSGISGANFWIPVNIIALKLEPRIGFWLALFTMLFGFGSGVAKHFQQHTINAKLIFRYLMLSIPGAVIGVLILPYVRAPYLMIAFGTFVAVYGFHMLILKNNFSSSNEKITLFIAFVGGMLKGMIASGLGKLLLPRLINKEGVTHPEAVGTAVGIVFLTNIVAVLSSLSNTEFHDALIRNWQQLFSIMVFVAPAVIIGGQIGPRIPERISKEHLIKYVGGVLLCISYFMIIRGLTLL